MIAVLIAVQAVLGLTWFLVERSLVADLPFTAERLDEAAPELRVEHRDGRAQQVVWGEGVTLVHFWATWCVPCREELPGLLEATRSSGVPLLAVSDEPWETIGTFFEGRIPEGVVRVGAGEAAARFGVSGLPDTFIVDEDGRIVARVGGARDWSGRGARAFLAGFVGEGPSSPFRNCR